MTNAVDNLLRLQRIAEQTGDRDLSAWCRDVAGRLRAGLAADQALGLCGPVALAARDRLLRAAAPLTGKPTPWQQAGAVAAILRRLARHQGRRQLSPVERLLIDAQRHAPCPGSQRQLYTILKNEIKGGAVSVDTGDSQTIDHSNRKQAHG